jgi:hypothetical protein
LELRTADDLAPDYAPPVDDVWRRTQRGLVYLSPNAIFVTFFPTRPFHGNHDQDAVRPDVGRRPPEGAAVGTAAKAQAGVRRWRGDGAADQLQTCRFDEVSVGGIREDFPKDEDLRGTPGVAYTETCWSS